MGKVAINACGSDLKIGSITTDTGSRAHRVRWADKPGQGRSPGKIRFLEKIS